MSATDFLTALFSPYQDPAQLLEIRCLWPKHVPPRYTQTSWETGQEEAKTAFSAWFPTSGPHEGAVKSALLWSREWDVYVGVLPRNGKRRFAVDVPEAHWLWVEVDGKNGGIEGAEDLLQKAVGLGLPVPAILVRSGGGVHAYWQLESAIALPDADARRTFCETLRRLVWAVGGVSWQKDKWGRYTGRVNADDPTRPYADWQCCDVARILRIPGTWNHKPDRQRVVELAAVNVDSPRWSYTKWQAWLPAMPVSPPPVHYGEPLAPGEIRDLPEKTKQDIASYWPLGTRHEAFLRILATARRCGWDMPGLEALGEMLIQHNQADRSHVMSLVRDTVRRVPAY